MNEKFNHELEFNEANDFELGQYIYMGMGLVKNKRVCLSVAYKIDYCLKKAHEFEHIDSNVKLTHINKVKVGDLEACDKFYLNH